MQWVLDECATHIGEELENAETDAKKIDILSMKNWIRSSGKYCQIRKDICDFISLPDLCGASYFYNTA